MGYFHSTGGGPSTRPKEDPILDKVCSMVGPTMDGLYTIYDGDSELMISQDKTPIERIDTASEEDTLFTNNRKNLKKKMNQKLTGGGEYHYRIPLLFSYL